MSDRLNDLAKTKYFANRGVERNKRPIANLMYKIEIIPFRKEADLAAAYEKYKFKELGYLAMSWTKTKADKKTGQFMWYWHGLITVDELKKMIGEKQFCKFCQGKREFVIQRRINGKNISRKNK